MQGDSVWPAQTRSGRELALERDLHLGQRTLFGESAPAAAHLVQLTDKLLAKRNQAVHPGFGRA